MNSINQLLDDQIEEEVRILPEKLKVQVLDFVGYLRSKYLNENAEDNEGQLLATFGSWIDDRGPDEIVKDIYDNRTISELEPDL